MKTLALVVALLFAGAVTADARSFHRHHHLRVASHKKPVQHHYALPDSVVADIRRTVEAAEPPPPPDSVIAFVEDIVDVVKRLAPDPFIFVRNPVDEARDYVQQTSIPGYTMFVQSRPVALSCLNPEFVVRLAAAIKEARANGIPAGVYSACRPPALRVGGMGDKSQSMHAYGLAVDIAGIGSPGSATACAWYRIAAAHGIIRPYATPWEWNHMQPTAIKVASQAPPMKKVLSPYGPTDLVKLWTTQVNLILPIYQAKPPEVVIHHHTHYARA
jgi:hypothetical protein